MKFIVSFLIVLSCQTLAENSDAPGSTADPPKCLPGTWVPASNGDYPRGALAIGGDGGRIAYLIRAIYNGAPILGNLYDRFAYVAKHGIELRYSNYEVFCGSDVDWHWDPIKGGHIPLNAMVVGKNMISEPVYACRGIVNNNYSAGQLIDGVCYVGYNFHEYSLTEYDILVEGVDNSKGCVPGTWVPASNGTYPRGGLPVGFDHGQLVYLIRGKYNGEVMTGKLVGGTAYVPYYGREYMVPYEVFCGGYGNFFLWQPYSGGSIPSNALMTGKNIRSVPMYVCRAIVKDSNYSVGKVVHRVCYVSYAGREHKIYQEYDILVENE